MPNFKIVGVWPFGLEGLWLRYAANFSSFPWIMPGLEDPPAPAQSKEGIIILLPGNTVIEKNSNLSGLDEEVPLDVPLHLLHRRHEVIVPAVDLVLAPRPRRVGHARTEPLGKLDEI